MVAVNISGTFRKDERPYNGLESLADALVDRDRLHETYVVVAVVRPHAIKTDAEDGSDTPTIRFDRIEPLAGDDADVAMALLSAAYKARTGRDDAPPPTLFDPLGEHVDEREVPEASAEEILAERAERQAAGLPAFSDGADA